MVQIRCKPGMQHDTKNNYSFNMINMINRRNGRKYTNLLQHQ